MAIKQRLDSPTNNFATLNPLSRYLQNNSSVTTLSDGNVKISFASGLNVDNTVFSSIPFSSGKIYCEYLDLSSSPNTNGQGMILGIHEVENLGNASKPNCFLISTGEVRQLWSNGSNTNYWWTGTPAQNDIYSFFVDLDSPSPQIKFYRNNSLLGSSVTITTDKTYVFSIMNYGWQATPSGVYNFGQDHTFGGYPNGLASSSGYPDSEGYGSFYYDPTQIASDVKAICTANLPEMTPTVNDDVPKDYFKTVIWTGNGTGTSRTIDIGIEADLVWSKRRSADASHSLVYDSVRGAAKSLSTSLTAEETLNHTNGYISSNLGSNSITYTDGDSTNFPRHNYNDSGINYVVWCWKAGGASVANNDGSITSTVSANQDAGFSIVTFTDPNNASNYTVGHGLGTAPSMIIHKERGTTGNWIVWHSSATTTVNQYLLLNTSGAIDTLSNVWGAAVPTSSVFGLKSGTSMSGGDTVVAYCWHSVEGYSKFGSYTGNGSTTGDGPYVYCGFRPAFVLIKSTSTGGWSLWDSARNPHNVTDLLLQPYNADPEYQFTSYQIDMLSNGFKIKNASANTSLNASATQYIFMAFAEQPFNYANAR